jgi:hypothetical protein
MLIIAAHRQTELQTGYAYCEESCLLECGAVYSPYKTDSVKLASCLAHSSTLKTEVTRCSEVTSQKFDAKELELLTASKVTHK